MNSMIVGFTAILGNMLAGTLIRFIGKKTILSELFNLIINGYRLKTIRVV